MAVARYVLTYMFITFNLYYGNARTHKVHINFRQTGQLGRSRAGDRLELTSAAVSSIRSRPSRGTSRVQHDDFSHGLG